ncbi:pyridoxal 5'-phosphate synthase [Streptomyces sp. NPDC051976]|uniref:pyridoxine/pyridoxamine 5'-phosphate oxidase n=1 Tax=Streptomyces sp. NPDC051976 TaxID=3154947 RepID=UPI00341D07C1
MSDLRETLRALEVFDGALPTFDTSELPADPHELFIAWLLAAVRQGVREPHAMTLSTVDADGDPAARVLILKNVSPDGWEFAADSTSPKGRDLAAHPSATLTFYWPALARQIRVRGGVTTAPPAASAADFLARSPSARAEALLGRQSGPLPDTTARDTAVRASTARVTAEPDLISPTWTLYALHATTVEFWQGDPDRNHTRVNYRRTEGTWERGLLWP